DRIVRRVRHGAVRPRPRVPEPGCNSLSDDVVEGPIVGRRKAPCRPEDRTETQRERERDEHGGLSPRRGRYEPSTEPIEHPHGKSRSSPTRSKSSTSSQAGSPTTFAYEPSIRCTKN